MEKGPWTSFCGTSECPSQYKNICSPGLMAIVNEDSCINHVLVISLDCILLFIFSYICLYQLCSRKIVRFSGPEHRSPIMILSVTFSICLGLANLAFGIWILYKQLSTFHTALPMHRWLVLLFQGFTWLLLGFIISLRQLYLPHITLVKLCAVLTFLFAGFLSISSLTQAILYEESSVPAVLNILSFPGAVLVLLYAFRAHKMYADSNNNVFYTALQSEEADTNKEITSNDHVTHFANAGFFSKMSFWWLNPLMKKGKEKYLEEQDIPLLREEDTAKMCYSTFMEQMNEQKQNASSDTPSILSVILLCQWKAILISGLFALTNVISLSTGPLFLRAFINVVGGNPTFKYESYLLAGGLFVVKCLESLSERQWYFRTRLIGVQVRSLLSAAIYQKQLRLSNDAKMVHSPGEIVNYVAVDAYKIGEFPYWFHQIWSTSLQLCIALAIVYYSVGLATVAALTTIILTVLASSPLAKLQHKFQKNLMMARDRRLKGITEALANMKILKLYAWETHFKSVVEYLRKEEHKWVSSVLTQKGYYLILFWSSPVLVPTVTFWACCFLGIPLNASNVFTFLASLRIVQQPIRSIPDVAGVFIEAKVSFHRIVKFLEAPEMQNRHKTRNGNTKALEHFIFIRASEVSWDSNSTKPTLKNINLTVKQGEKVAICGEVGSGKSTLLAAILGEVPHINGTVQVYGKIAYVSQSPWIQTGTIQDNILFGSSMDPVRYQETLAKCSLLKDIEMLPFRDLTVIGERGVNLSGGQRQRVQLARALYQDADVYLLDDPFSAVDAHTATSLFNDYVMGALSGKSVLLVTHHADFLPAFDSILFMSAGGITKAASYEHLLASSQEFQHLVNVHGRNDCSKRKVKNAFEERTKFSQEEIESVDVKKQLESSLQDQLIKQEERETGNTGLKPYLQYLRQGNGVLYFSLAAIFHVSFVAGQLTQNYWLAANMEDSTASTVRILAVYSMIACVLAFFLLLRSFFLVTMGREASKSTFSELLNSLFRAPMSFYDSTPLGRILSRVSSDVSIIDTEIAFRLTVALGTTMTACASFIVLVVFAWPVLLIVVPVILLSIFLQRYYFASSKELMRLTGTTKSLVASHLAEAIAGATTIRAFREENQFFMKYLSLVDGNASPYFHSFSANEWLIQRLEIMCAFALSSSALAMALLPLGTSAAGFVGMALSYGLSLNVSLVFSVQYQCMLENLIVSVERLEQYMHIPSEAPEIIEDKRPPVNWPVRGEVDIRNLKVRYRPTAPLVLQGISCSIEGGQKIGIVGRTGSGKTTLISVLFRLVEPTEGRIIVDDIDISTIGLHDLRSRLGIIPQEPTLFHGSVRYNLDPLSKHIDKELWEVLEKCQLREVVQDKEDGLNSLVVEDGSNWSMGQKQLLCLARCLLKRSRLLVLDEATASMDNVTDSIIQKTIHSEFADCTVMTVAHRIPTVMDCNMVLSISDGKLVEYGKPMELINREGSLFGQLYKEYYSRSSSADEE